MMAIVAVLVVVSCFVAWVRHGGGGCLITFWTWMLVIGAVIAIWHKV